MIKHWLLIPLLAVLAACGGPLSTAAHVAGVPPPVELSNKTKLDEKAGIAVETMYTAIVKAGALAFRTGLVPVSTNPVVRHPDFCPRVLTRTFMPTDRGSELAALECKLRKARDLTRDAYDASNGDSYDTAAREAVRLGKEILALIGSN